jgi:hypothetical protein
MVHSSYVSIDWHTIEKRQSGITNEKDGKPPPCMPEIELRIDMNVEAMLAIALEITRNIPTFLIGIHPKVLVATHPKVLIRNILSCSYFVLSFDFAVV